MICKNPFEDLNFCTNCWDKNSLAKSSHQLPFKKISTLHHLSVCFLLLHLNSRAHRYHCQTLEVTWETFGASHIQQLPLPQLHTTLKKKKKFRNGRMSPYLFRSLKLTWKYTVTQGLYPLPWTRNTLKPAPISPGNKRLGNMKRQR